MEIKEDLRILNVTPGKKIRISLEDEEPKRRSKPFWKMYKEIGVGTKKRSLAVEMENISKGANWLFWRLNNIRNEYTCIAKLIPKDDTEKKKILRAYKELKALGIVIRVKRGHYMVNPNIMGPWSGYEVEAEEAWDKLIRGKVK